MEINNKKKEILKLRLLSLILSGSIILTCSGCVSKAKKDAKTTIYTKNAVLTIEELEALIKIVNQSTEEDNYSNMLPLDKETSVIIGKEDVSTKKQVPGATYQIKDSSGRKVERWVTTDIINALNNNPKLNKQYCRKLTRK